MVYYRVTGDTESPLGPDRLTDEDGSDIDITGATVELHVWPRGDKSTSFISDDTNGNVTITSANPAKVEYDFQSGDLDDSGHYHYEWEVQYAGGGTETWPGDESYGLLIVREEGD